MMQMMTRTAIHPLKIAAALGAAFLVWGLVLAYASSPALAADITVDGTADTVADDGECTLREAITSANTDTSSGAAGECEPGSGADTIHLPSGTITLSSTLPFLVSTITIDGGSSQNPTISGNDQVQVFLAGSAAKLTLSNLTVANGNATTGSGGAIANFSGDLTVNNSTFSGNSGGSGGAIVNTAGGTVVVSNSTFSGNRATFSWGGGIANLSGDLTVNNSTFSGNSAPSGGGILNFGAATLKNTIVANSPSGGDCVGASDGGYNLVEDGSCITAATSLSEVDPLLGALADNGGPTKTHALLEGSPAIDAIPDTNGSTPGCGDAGITTDQRGVARPQGSACDIGAYEVEVGDNTPPTVTDTSPDGIASKTDNVTATFSEPVQNVSTSTFILERNIAAKVKTDPPKYVLVDATVELKDGRYVLDPVQDLPKGNYRATITTDVTDLADNALEEAVVWTFTVRK